MGLKAYRGFLDPRCFLIRSRMKIEKQDLEEIFMEFLDTLPAVVMAQVLFKAFEEAEGQLEATHAQTAIRLHKALTEVVISTVGQHVISSRRRVIDDDNHHAGADCAGDDGFG